MHRAPSVIQGKHPLLSAVLVDLFAEQAFEGGLAIMADRVLRQQVGRRLDNQLCLRHRSDRQVDGLAAPRWRLDI
eukprot:275181-Alexandrium_andersonii.AAC.1